MEKFFKIALNEASKALKKNEIPVGAVVVKDGKVLSKGHNLRQKKNNPLCHAEIISILKACKKNKDWRLDDCEMYVTLKPCKMCESVIEECRIKKVFYILDKKKSIKSKTNYIQTNDCKKEISDMLELFFNNLRK